MDVALLVHTCDRYAFLYNGFEYFFNRYWDRKVRCRYYFATECIDAQIHGFQNVKSGKGAWSDRLRYLLIHVIKEDYVLYFQEDMWLKEKVSGGFFNQLFDLVQKNQWKQVKLHSADVYKTRPTDHYLEGFNISQLDVQSSDYLMSHQVTLWEKSHLLRLLSKGEHPWRNERKGTQKLRKMKLEIHHCDYFAENGYPEINQNIKPVSRSAYDTVSVNSILNKNVLKFVHELQMDHGDFKQYASRLLYHYTQQLTHDGKAKPRKKDMFKVIKESFCALCQYLKSFQITSAKVSKGWGLDLRLRR